MHSRVDLAVKCLPLIIHVSVSNLNKPVDSLDTKKKNANDYKHWTTLRLKTKMVQSLKTLRFARGVDLLSTCIGLMPCIEVVITGVFDLIHYQECKLCRQPSWFFFVYMGLQRHGEWRQQNCMYSIFAARQLIIVFFMSTKSTLFIFSTPNSKKNSTE